jgi:hypothetical protein
MENPYMVQKSQHIMADGPCMSGLAHTSFSSAATRSISRAISFRAIFSSPWPCDCTSRIRSSHSVRNLPWDVGTCHY